MNIFISHSSENAGYGRALVELLTSLGITHDSITFTSDASYGIPTGENIFDWLKGRISEKPFVIYLLSPEYYSSVACLNEMGAAWIIENKHIMVFTPDFDKNSSEFRSGAVDPREMGFFLHDPEKLVLFAERVKEMFGLSANSLIVKRACDKFSMEIKKYQPARKYGTPPIRNSHSSPAPVPLGKPITSIKPASKGAAGSSAPKSRRLPPVERFFEDLTLGKLRDEEVLLVRYASDTGRASFGVGWRIEEEISRIKEWEDLNDLCDTLSSRYEAAVNRLAVRNLTQVSETTSHGNPRQVDFIKEMTDVLLDLPDDLFAKSDEIVRKALENKNEPYENKSLF